MLFIYDKPVIFSMYILTKMLTMLNILVIDTPYAEISGDTPIFFAITKQLTAAGAQLIMASVIR